MAPAPLSMPAAAALTQFRSVCSTSPNSLAAAPAVSPSLTCETANFFKLGCVLLLRYLHRLPFHGDYDYTSPVEDEIPGEAQPFSHVPRITRHDLCPSGDV